LNKKTNVIKVAEYFQLFSSQANYHMKTSMALQK